MNDKFNLSYWVVKVGIRLFALFALLLFFWNFSEVAAAYIISTQIEWASPSSVGGMIFAGGMLLSAVVVDFTTERIYQKINKESV